MGIEELKQMISDKSLPDDFMIWVLEDDTSRFIADQYIHEICSQKHRVPKIIDSFDEIPDTSFTIDDNLYIIEMDKPGEIEERSNCILLCKKGNGIKIPKLEDWQMASYIESKVPGIDKEQLLKITELYKRNYYRLSNDMDKISIFPKESQKIILNKLIEDGQFKDITTLTIWDLSNAIIRNEKDKVRDILKFIEYMDVEPLGLLKSLYKSFKNVINIQLGNVSDPNSLGINSKQYYVIKKFNCNKYSGERLVKIFNTLTEIEHLFKYGSLEQDQIIDYLIIKILGE